MRRPLACLVLLAASGTVAAQGSLAGAYKGMREIPDTAVHQDPKPRMMYVTVEILAVNDLKVEGRWQFKGGRCEGTYPFAGMLRGNRLIVDVRGEGECPPARKVAFEVGGDALIWRPQGDEIRLTR